MKNFGLEVQAASDGDDYDGSFYPLKITDMGMTFADMKDCVGIAEVEVESSTGSIQFQLTYEDCQAFINVLEHIRKKIDDDEHRQFKEKALNVIQPKKEE